ncbi:putative malic acid transport protein [Podospora aff. communis PSN243]|uniref:Malic acid transport protein n=1 Tax=Podospora aff. communis PSN243 TaxID=3040156 RepID=A0AAV9GGP1_9PEZI|nr:putative malic acid transport protein [Podospora aff. communis PSN243]
MATEAIDYSAEPSTRRPSAIRIPTLNGSPNGSPNGNATKPEPEAPPPDPDPLSDPQPLGARRASHSTTATARRESHSAPSDFVVLERIPTFLQPSLPWRDRLLHFTFAWYTVTMSTSGVSLVLAIAPKRFPGLSTLGLVIFLLDLLFFLFITAAISLRFMLYKHTLRRAFTRPSEALFVPTLMLSLAAIISNIAEYTRLFLSPRSGGAISRFLEVAFWSYLVVTFLLSILQYHLLFTVKADRRLAISSMTPAWILPIFPVMLAGTIAGGAAKNLPAERAVSVLAAGLAAQGLGFLVSAFFYATYLGRLMAHGLPVQRPGMFIAVGPPSFTCAAFVAIAAEMPRIFAELSAPGEVGKVGGILVSDLTGQGDVATLAAGIRVAAVVSGVFLWGLSFWFFTSAVVAVAAGMPDRKFHLSWWSFVFPNVGFTISSIRIGNAVGSQGVLWTSTVMTAVLFVAWAFILFRCVRAVRKREIVWPGHDEDA